MSTPWKPFEQAAKVGMDKAGIYPHAQPGRLVMTAILVGLEQAGLLVTEARLASVAAAVEEIDTDGLTAAQVQALAAEAVRAGGSPL